MTGTLARACGHGQSASWAIVSDRRWETSTMRPRQRHRRGVERRQRRRRGRRVMGERQPDPRNDFSSLAAAAPARFAPMVEADGPYPTR